MDLNEKLQLKPDMRIAVLGLPSDVDLSLGEYAAAEPADADAVIAFLHGSADLERVAAEALTAARADRLVWLAYPKAGQLDTDLNRDSLAEAVQAHGVQPVRQVSVDDVWSALRVRPS